MRIEVNVPSLISDCTGGQVTFWLDADTLEEALQRLLQTYPLLRTHLYDEAMKLRQHVLIYYNEDSIDWLERRDVPLKHGDRLTVFQAVSGG
jgi:molybdopterin converting factor small subunit